MFLFACAAAPAKAYVLRSLLPAPLRARALADPGGDPARAFALVVIAILNMNGGAVSKGVRAPPACVTRGCCHAMQGEVMVGNLVGSGCLGRTFASSICKDRLRAGVFVNADLKPCAEVLSGSKLTFRHEVLKVSSASGTKAQKRTHCNSDDAEIGAYDKLLACVAQMYCGSSWTSWQWWRVQHTPPWASLMSRLRPC